MNTLLGRSQCLTILCVCAPSLLAQTCLWTDRPPEPPGYGRVVYHSGLGRVLFVRTDGPNLAAVEVWSWNGSDWTLQSGAGPSIRTGAGVAYDSVRDRLVLFGGYAPGPVYQNTTWEWDRTAWTQAAQTGPSGRAGPAMAYDQARQRTVLFGGYSGVQAVPLGDTWEWDGAAWSQRAAAGPSARVPTIAYDSGRARTVIFGGWTATGYLHEVWEWNGVSWLQRPDAPFDTQVTWMVYDPGRARLITTRWWTTGDSQQTWEMDPATAAWTLRDPGLGPLGPGAFDAARSVAVVLNPYAASGTREYNGAGTAVSPNIMQQPVGGTYGIGTTIVVSIQAGGQAPTYQWYRDGTPLVDGGRISGVTTTTLVIQSADPNDSGTYQVHIADLCRGLWSDYAGVLVPACYPNCDHSTVPPYLNIADFGCFLNAFAAGETYANCTGGCNPPPCLNVQDFACFLNRFAAGCSSP